MRLKTLFLTCFFVHAGLALGAHAQLVNDDSVIPNEGSDSENVDFGDVDLDGDWDIVVADGGDGGNDQNRLWINQGGAQGGTLGMFLDRTTTMMPSLLDDSRDAEFGDFDNDGDIDLYISNTAQISNQGNRWLTNDGSGNYVDETGLRWVGLGQAGSSIPASLVIPAGSPGGGNTFIDFSCDCDFGDLDNDGDLDLFHSTYGGAFGGQIPSRVFTNDGDGNFVEFNPSGFQLPTSNIQNGQPGLWCDGVQQANTVNSSGAFCDIASTALDIDLGDIDGDFDLDVLHGARGEAPRMFANRLDGSTLAPTNGGALGFRDVTGSSFPPGYTSGGGHYEQEMGDLDGDGDLDIYGLNWGGAGSFGFDDNTMRNTGAGVFDTVTILSGSSPDDNEGDFFDYDNDGDLDLFVANFSGSDRLYRNNNNGSATFSFTQISFGAISVTSLDADCCDTDGDGDYDVLVAADNGAPNRFYRNTTQIPDTHAPYLPNVEDTGARVATAEPVAVRAHVYDNAPYYITWYNPTDISYAVDGVSLGRLGALSSGGQVFRAELPGNLVGDVSYRFGSEDWYGNTGQSALTTNAWTAPAGSIVEYGTGTAGTLGEPTIDALSVPFAGTTLHLLGGNAPAATPCALALGNLQVPPTPIGNLATLNVFGSPTFLVLEFTVTDSSGKLLRSYPVAANAVPGFTAYAQFFSLNGTSQTYASSKGLAVMVP
ncbi:MAG: VCBS repeat-containing protein [Planctomycetota bacterium]